MVAAEPQRQPIEARPGTSSATAPATSTTPGRDAEPLTESDLREQVDHERNAGQFGGEAGGKEGRREDALQRPGADATRRDGLIGWEVALILDSVACEVESDREAKAPTAISSRRFIQMIIHRLLRYVAGAAPPGAMDVFQHGCPRDSSEIAMRKVLTPSQT